MISRRRISDLQTVVVSHEEVKEALMRAARQTVELSIVSSVLGLLSM